MKPITREEQLLSAAAGNGTAPTPITREEYFLAEIANGGGGGGGGIVYEMTEEEIGGNPIHTLHASYNQIVANIENGGIPFACIKTEYEEDGATGVELSWWAFRTLGDDHNTGTLPAPYACLLYDIRGNNNALLGADSPDEDMVTVMAD